MQGCNEYVEREKMDRCLFPITDRKAKQFEGGRGGGMGEEMRISIPSLRWQEIQLQRDNFTACPEQKNKERNNANTENGGVGESHEDREERLHIEAFTMVV